MKRLWINHKWAVLIFATISCAAILVPHALDLGTEYYIAHPPTEIPAPVRVLMAAGLFVTVLRIPIILVSGFVIFVTSFILGVRRNRAD
jgi:hypothetical protein